MIKQTAEKNSTPPPFPQALKAKKKAINQAEMLEVLRQIKVNIPLLDMIKKVPTYVKFLKDLCTMKKGLNADKKAFLIEQVSVIIQCKTPVKYKDPDCPTILVNIGGTCVEKALLDLGTSVNLLLYSMYKKWENYSPPPSYCLLQIDPSRYHKGQWKMFSSKWTNSTIQWILLYLIQN